MPKTIVIVTLRYTLNLGSVNPPFLNFFLFSQIMLTFLGPLYFHIDFIINWPNNKNFCWSFDIALNVISLMVISVSTLYHLEFPDACTH